MLFNLIQQLVKSPIRPWFSAGKIKEYYKAGFQPLVTNIAGALENVVAEYKRVFVVIDALDECGEEHRCTFLKEIFRLQATLPIHLFATSDFDPKIAALFTNADSLEVRADKQDMRAYLGCHMSRLPSFMGDYPGLEEEIMCTILETADGRSVIPPRILPKR